jgi:hypothetical protein
MKKINKTVLLLLIIIGSNVNALSEKDYLYEKNNSDCEIINLERNSSIQIEILYEYTPYEKILPPLLKKSYLSLNCKENLGKIFYFEYKSESDAISALNFIRPLVLGGPVPSDLHPERVYNVENLIVIIDSKNCCTIDNEVFRHLFKSRIPNETLDQIKKIIQEDINSNNKDFVEVLDNLKKENFSPIKDQKILIGKSFFFKPNVNPEINYTVLEINSDKNNSSVIFSSIIPDDSEEENDWIRMINEQKEKKSSKKSKKFDEFYNRDIINIKKKITIKNDKALAYHDSGTDLQIFKTQQMYICILTTNHILRKKTSFLIAYFYY